MMSEHDSEQLQSMQTFLSENELRLHSDLVKDINKHCSQLILDFGCRPMYTFPNSFDNKIGKTYIQIE